MGGEGPRRPPSPRLALPLALAQELPGCDGRGQASIGGLGLGWESWDGTDGMRNWQSRASKPGSQGKEDASCMHG